MLNASRFSTRCSMPHTHTEVCFEHSLYPIVTPKQEGYLQVSDIHRLFYATYGNPEGIPVVVLHGGPGAGCSDNLSQFFDLTRWHVVMFDQRGAMRSMPFGCMEENTPHHSVADIEVLRKHLGIEKWMVFGGSWGSTLAILYGQAHPEACLGFILRGIYLGTELGYLHLFYSMGQIFPEAYEPFLSHIPVEERHDLVTACYRRVMDPDPEVHMGIARAFMRYDTLCSTHVPNPEAVEKTLQNDRLTLSLSKAFMYYSKHRFFLEPDHILSQMDRVKNLPAMIVQGRWDAITLPYMAYSLHKNWTNSTLWMVSQGGHSCYDPAVATALAKATDFFAEKS